MQKKLLLSLIFFELTDALQDYCTIMTLENGGQPCSSVITRIAVKAQTLHRAEERQEGVICMHI